MRLYLLFAAFFNVYFQSIECQQELISVALQQQPVGIVLKMAEQHCENTHKQFMGKIRLGV